MLSAPPFRPATETADILRAKDPWLVPGFIPLDGLVVLASAPKTGKTCFATAMARALARGEEFLGHPLKPAPVLWCAHEESPYERTPLHEGLSVDDPFLIAYPGDLPPLPIRIPGRDRFGRTRDLRDLEPPLVFERASQVGAKLIVIDCLHAAVEGASLADNGVARAVMGTLRTWGFHFHIAVLVLHHLTKSGTRGYTTERIADSAQILAASSCHFFMDREDETETRSRIVLHGRGRHPAPYPRVELISEGILDYRLAELAQARSSRLTIEQKIVNLLSEGWHFDSAEIARRIGHHPVSVRNALSALTTAGRIKTTTKHHRRWKYAASEITLDPAPSP